jgi:hypothetical protein
VRPEVLTLATGFAVEHDLESLERVRPLVAA